MVGLMPNRKRKNWESKAPAEPNTTAIGEWRIVFSGGWCSRIAEKIFGTSGDVLSSFDSLL